MDKIKNTKLIIIGAAVLAAAGLLYIHADVITNRDLNKEEAAEIALDFINKSIQDDVTASLIEMVDEGQVYGIHLDISGNEYYSYMTKDGKFLFGNGFNLKEIAEQEARELTQ